MPSIHKHLPTLLFFLIYYDIVLVLLDQDIFWHVFSINIITGDRTKKNRKLWLLCTKRYKTVIRVLHLFTPLLGIRFNFN